MHLKIWTNPNTAIATMLTSMQDVYGTAGIDVVIGSREDLTGGNILTALRDLDVVPNCPAGQLTGEQIQLFNNRNSVGELSEFLYL